MASKQEKPNNIEHFSPSLLFFSDITVSLKEWTVISEETKLGARFKVRSHLRRQIIPAAAACSHVSSMEAMR